MENDMLKKITLMSLSLSVCLLFFSWDEAKAAETDKIPIFMFLMCMECYPNDFSPTGLSYYLNIPSLGVSHFQGFNKQKAVIKQDLPVGIHNITLGITDGSKNLCYAAMTVEIGLIRDTSMVRSKSAVIDNKITTNCDFVLKNAKTWIDFEASIHK